MITLDKPAIILAPMDGVTDPLMRRLLTQRMPFSGCVSEFVRVSGLVPPKKVLVKSVPEIQSGSVTDSGVPVAIQLLGGDPDRLARTAQLAVEMGANCIDLNFGCPAPTVNRHDGGATLLRFPERIEGIVRAVRSALPIAIPVSAKFRLGWDDSIAIHENAERAARGGANWIAIHGRTKMQGYHPPAFWEPIGAVNRALDIPVIANGEIWNVDDLKRCQDITECQHFMLGRGVLANPILATQCARHLGLRVVSDGYEGFDGEAVWSQIVSDVVWLSREKGEAERRTLSRVKQWLNYAHKRGCISWFSTAKRCRDIKELLSTLDRCGVPTNLADFYRNAIAAA
jgi:tRNA-dihydrouridine synthase C